MRGNRERRERPISQNSECIAHSGVGRTASLAETQIRRTTQEQSYDQLSATVAVDKGILSLLILSLSPKHKLVCSPVASPEREGVSSPLKTEIPKSAAAAASLGEASSHRFSPSLLPSTTQRMAGWLLPSIPSYFFLSFLPFFSTLYIRIALLSPFRKTSLSLFLPLR